MGNCSRSNKDEEFALMDKDEEGDQPSGPKATRLVVSFLVLLFTAGLIALLVLLIYFVIFYPTNCQGFHQFPNATLAEGWCGHIIFKNLQKARQIISLGNGDLLLLERSDNIPYFGRIRLITFNSTTFDYHMYTIVENAPGNCEKLGNNSCITHGIQYFKGHIYATSDHTMYRWKYELGSYESITTYEVTMINIPPCAGGHRSRTMQFDGNGLLFLSIGALGNIDPDASHAEIRRFDFSDIQTQNLPIDYTSGLVWASGTRNEVGLTIDSKGRLWGVENGIDSLTRPDLGDIMEHNPSEEVNLFDFDGFYGYPYCFSEFSLPENISRGVGSQWVTPPFYEDGNHSDEWCEHNAIRPIYNLPAHCAPLDLKFYDGDQLPDRYHGDLFITRHGGGTEQTSNGAKILGFDVVSLDFEGGGDVPKEGESILKWIRMDEEGLTPADVTSNWHKFVSVAWGPCPYGDDCLYVTSDNVAGPLGGIVAVLRPIK